MDLLIYILVTAPVCHLEMSALKALAPANAAQRKQKQDTQQHKNMERRKNDTEKYMKERKQTISVVEKTKWHCYIFGEFQERHKGTMF